MKKILLIVIIFLALQAKAQETYFNMLDSNVIWSQVDISTEPETPTVSTPYEYRTDGDTIIEGKAYFKIIKDDYEEPFLAGYMRQNDSGQVYFRIVEEGILDNICYLFAVGDPPLNTDLLLMDFGVNIGDTITFPFESTFSDDSIVYIYSVQYNEIAGEPHRIVYYSNDFDVDGSWIEGVGSNMGLFSFWCPPGLGEYTELSCYWNNEPIYGNCVTSIVEVKTELDLLIFPNPARKIVYITIANNVKIEKIRVFEVTGRVIFEKAFYGILPDEDGMRGIDVRALSPGIYLIEVETEDGLREVKRIVVE